MDAGTQEANQDSLMTVIGKAFASRRLMMTSMAFCVLCFAGQLLTFGMTYMWVVLLQTEAFKGAALSQATSLSLIRSFEVPSAFLMIPILGSSIGHRRVITVTSFLEVAALYGCMTLFSRGAPNMLLLLAGLSIAFAIMLYTTIVLFMTESFPTSVRSIMTSVCMFIGRTGAILGPFLFTRFGFQGYVVFVSGITLTALPFLLLLSETKGQQLEDYLMEDENAGVGESSPLLARGAAKRKDSSEKV
jgi:MFS family permease